MQVFDARLLSVLFSLLFIVSCAKDADVLDPVPVSPDNTSKSYSNVDSRLWSHYSKFEHEASIRGIEINLDLEKVTAQISNIEYDDVAGTCHFGNHIQNHITIDKAFWNSASNSLREFVVFHELGHCALHRDHTEAQDQNGTCLSIMASGTGDCIVRFATNREYYLDELFFNN